MTTCDSCGDRPATVTTGPTWAICDDCARQYIRWNAENGEPEPMLLPLGHAYSPHSRHDWCRHCKLPRGRH